MVTNILTMELKSATVPNQIKGYISSKNKTVSKTRVIKLNHSIF